VSTRYYTLLTVLIEFPSFIIALHPLLRRMFLDTLWRSLVVWEFRMESYKYCAS